MEIKYIIRILILDKIYSVYCQCLAFFKHQNMFSTRPLYEYFFLAVLLNPSLSKSNESLQKTRKTFLYRVRKFILDLLQNISSSSLRILQIRSHKHEFKVDIVRGSPSNWRYFQRRKGGEKKVLNPLDVQMFILLISKFKKIAHINNNINMLFYLQNPSHEIPIMHFIGGFLKFYITLGKMHLTYILILQFHKLDPTICRTTFSFCLIGENKKNSTHIFSI